MLICQNIYGYYIYLIVRISAKDRYKISLLSQKIINEINEVDMIININSIVLTVSCTDEIQQNCKIVGSSSFGR